MANVEAGVRMAALMLQIVQALVDEPDAVRVVPRQTELGIVLDISVAPGDLGKVIGKQGRTARSLRTILCAASTTTGVIHHLDLLQDQPQERVGN